MPSLISSYDLDNDTAMIGHIIYNTNYVVILQCSYNINPPASCMDMDAVSVVKKRKERERERLCIYYYYTSIIKLVI